MTATTDLDALPFEELAKMRKDLDAAIERKKKEALQNIIRGCAERLREAGYSDAEFLAAYEAELRPIRASGQRKRGAGLTTYKDPASAATWTGKGKAPGWMAAHLAAGGKKEDLKVA
jgi:DNA-binding protein H-NS